MLSIVIQAGGKSTRIGKNKALINFQGERLIERIIHRVYQLTDDLLVITNQPEEFSFLKVRSTKDLITGIGPLGGIYTALHEAKNEFVAILACDMPFINPDILQAEYILARENGYDVVVPRIKNGLEPLHAVYKKETCLEAVRTSIENRHNRLISWFSQVKTAEFGVEMIEKFDPEFLSFLNLNTPEDWARAEAIADRLSD